MAGDDGIVLRLRVCEDAIEHLRALDDPSVLLLIRDIERLAAELRARLTGEPRSADRSANPS